MKMRRLIWMAMKEMMRALMSMSLKRRPCMNSIHLNIFRTDSSRVRFSLPIFLLELIEGHWELQPLIELTCMENGRRCRAACLYFLVTKGLEQEKRNIERHFWWKGRLSCLLISKPNLYI